MIMQLITSIPKVAPPSSAELLLKVQLMAVNFSSPWCIAPPWSSALLPMKVQLIAPPLKIAPPSSSAWLSVKLQFIALPVCIAPPDLPA